MKILLTGSNGFLGKILKENLSEKELYTLGRFNTTYVFNLAKQIPILDQDFELVIHAAGLAHIYPKTSDQIQEFYDVNVTGTENLLAALHTSKTLKYFVFISTVAVYGQSSGELISEDSPLLAKDPYGKSKIDAENLIKTWCFSNGVKCTVLRLPLVAGPNPPGNLGFMIKGLKKGFFFNIGTGEAKKSIVLGEDIAKHLLSAALKGGVYNLTDGYHPSFYELSCCIGKQIGVNKIMSIPFWFALLIAKFGDIIGKKAPLNSYKLKKLTSTLTFCDKKARSSFGWNPHSVIEHFKIT